jgi:hypothetical protein
MYVCERDKQTDRQTERERISVFTIVAEPYKPVELIDIIIL